MAMGRFFSFKEEYIKLRNSTPFLGAAFFDEIVGFDTKVHVCWIFCPERA